MIVSCGEALVDLVPEPVPGGGPMNVAIAAARLGAPSAFVGRVSTDRYGDAIWAHLRDNGVELSACERGPEPTARAFVEHTPRLRFRFEGDDTVDMNLGAVDLGLLGGGPHIVHGGTLGMFRGRTADVLAELVERHDGMVSFDPNVRPQIIGDRSRWDHFHARWIARSHVYKASDEDFGWAWPDRAPESCAEELLSGQACVVFLTQGSEGVRVLTRHGEIVVPAPQVQVSDTVGAGDTFVGAVLTSLWDLGVAGRPEALASIDEATWRAVAERAVAAAAITCSRPGANPPFAAELA